MITQNIAVIFDMDGVLVDNSEFHQRAFQEYFQNSGGKAFTRDMFGKSNDDIMSLMFPGITKAQIDIYAEGKEAHYRQIYAPHIQPMEGLIDLLKTLKDNNIKIAVGSSAPRANVDFVLDALNIRSYFNQIVDSSGVSKGKPDPEIYLKAARLLEVNPTQCLVFEDALAGIEAARRAGMKVVGVATTLSFDELSHTDARVHNFNNIDTDFVRTIINS